MQKGTTDPKEDGDDVGALTGQLSKLTLPTSNEAAGSKPPRGRRSGPTRAERSFADSKKSGTEDGLLFDPADYPEKEKRDRMLEKFLKTSLPSTVKRSEEIGWIRVRSASFNDEGLGDLDNLDVAWNALLKSKKHIGFDAIKALALSSGCLSGIWLLFFDTGVSVDTAWEKIARATVEDKLGTHAKVTPYEDKGEGKKLHGNQHCISVYTKDFTDKDDVLAVEVALRGLGFNERMSFKPRVYSNLGIYSQNQWKLRPSIFISQWDAAKQAGNIQDGTKSRKTYWVNYPSRKK